MKLKSHKATAKRIKFTPAGKILRDKTAKSHLLSHKANPPKFSIEVARSDQKKIKRMLPYS